MFGVVGDTWRHYRFYSTPASMVAVLEAGGCAVITLNQYATLSMDHRTDMESTARRSCGPDVCSLHQGMLSAWATHDIINSSHTLMTNMPRAKQ